MHSKTVVTVVVLAACAESGPDRQWQGVRDTVDAVEVVRNPSEPLVPVGEAALSRLWYTEPASLHADSLWEDPRNIRVSGDAVFVLDRPAARVYGLSRSAGVWNLTFGKKGGGPGELDRTFGIAVNATHVAVGDGGKAGISLFHRDGEFDRVLQVGGIGFALYPHGADGFLVNGMIDRQPGYVVVAADGSRESFPMPESALPDDYTDQDCHRVGKSGPRLLRLRCILPRFHVADETGTLVRELVIDLEPEETPEEEIERVVAERQDLMGGSGVPNEMVRQMGDVFRSGLRFKQKYQDARHDPLNGTYIVWEQQPRDLGGGHATLHVFSETGVYLASINAASSWVDFDVLQGTVYALVRDAETDLVGAAAYSLELPEWVGGAM
jgi:hypothetical protein